MNAEGAMIATARVAYIAVTHPSAIAELERSSEDSSSLMSHDAGPAAAQASSQVPVVHTTLPAATIEGTPACSF
jgi:hypothetical protein